MEKMENICLDTDVLVDFLRNKKEAIAYIEANEFSNILATTYVNLFELYYGAMLSNSVEQNLAALEKIQKRLTILNLSKESVKIAGKMLAELEKKGNTIDFRDLLIGTTALAQGFSIKTYNIKHFSKIKELNVIQ